jgi:putative transposase
MPKTTKTTRQDELLDELIKGVTTADELFAKDGIFFQLKKAALERMLAVELTEHLGYAKHAAEGFNGGNSRNGGSSKTLTTDQGQITVEVPRDRDGSFEPQVVKKGQRRLNGFNDQLIALYARGLSVRDIQSHIKEMYGTEVSPDLISRVTDGVLEEVHTWQTRPLDDVYPIVFLDGFVVKVRDERVVQNRTVFIALGINAKGLKDVLGLWIAQTEGAKFWMQVVTDLRNRGVRDILLAATDGLKGFPEAIGAVFPKTVVQTCIVHVIRSSTHLVAWTNRRAVAADLRSVYTASTEESALVELDRFDGIWGKLYPSISKSWRTNWERIAPFYSFPPELRRAIYTTNAVESLNSVLRRATKTRGSFPSADAAFKLLWLTIDRASRTWTFPIKNWDLVVQQLAILFEDRMPVQAYSA